MGYKNPEAGLVADWIYVSSDLLHTIIFGLDPGRSFRHSEDFRTIFGADEVLHVLQGPTETPGAPIAE